MPRVLNIRLERDLVWINLLSVILILVVSLFSISFLRIILGVPFILFFPGYTLICALFPRNTELEGIERFAISIGLSIAVVPLLGLVLNYTPFGIRLYPVLVSLFAFTFLLSVAAIIRRKNLSVEERFVPSFSLSVPRWAEMNRVDKTLSMGLVIGVVISGALVSSFLVAPRVGDRFTQFYVLGPSGKLEGYPTNLTLGESGTVILGVINQEYKEVNYDIVVMLDDHEVGSVENIGLMHEEKWEQNFTFVPQKVGDEMKLEFLLFMDDDVDPYRSLQLWIMVNHPS